MELCSKCNQLKDVTAFSKRAASPNGLQDACKACKSESNKEYRESHKAKELARHKKYREENIEAEAARQKKYREENIEAVRQRWNDYYAAHKVELVKKQKHNRANYRASKLQRTPSWASLESINEFYKNCPKGYHVDHEIPLQGKTVSGLHVRKNLQYLPARENLSKGCKFEPNIIGGGM